MPSRKLVPDRTNYDWSRENRENRKTRREAIVPGGLLAAPMTASILSIISMDTLSKPNLSGKARHNHVTTA